MDTIHTALHKTRLYNIKPKGLCIFAGAGISFNSGIPIVTKIKQYVVSRLCDDEKEQKVLLSSKIPFEVFVEILFRTYLPPVSQKEYPEGKENEALVSQLLNEALRELNIGDNMNRHEVFFDLFGHDYYRPNANHYFIASMLKEGVARFAATTNFDLLIEKAYKEITGQDLPVYFPDSREDYQFPCLFKLHGGCQKPETIQTTINKIASNNARERCRRMIDYIFRAGEHSTVMILGYSFSDVFDISPSIEDITRSGKWIVNVKHPDNAEEYSSIYYDELGDKQPTFKGFKGHQLHCATESVVNALWEHYLSRGTASMTNPEILPPDLNDIIGGWAANLSEPHQKYYIWGSYMSYLERTRETIQYFEKCLETKKAKEDKEFRIRVLQSLLSEDIADQSGRQQELDELLEYANTGVKIQSLLGKAQQKIMLGDSKDAFSDCEKALELSLNSRNRLQEGQCYSSMANILNTEKEYRKAIEYGEKALQIFQDENDFECLKIRCNVFCFLASSYECLEQKDKSRYYLGEAMSLAKKLNIESEIARIYFFFANSYDTGAGGKDIYRKAIDYYMLGYEYCKDKESIKPMLRDSAYYLLSSTILNLRVEDETMVSREELDLAYTLIKYVANNGVLTSLRKDVEKDVITCYVNACYAHHKVEEALNLILENLAKTDPEDKVKLEQLIALAIFWYEQQETSAYRRIPSVQKGGPVISSSNLLDDALGFFMDDDYVNGALTLQKAFEYIPVNRSFKGDFPAIIYIKLQRIRRELNNMYDRLCTKA